MSFLDTLLRQCVEVYPPFLTKAINHKTTKNIFPKQLNKSEVILLYKKVDSLKKKNFRPMSLLSHISKVFERIIYRQINIYIKDKLSKQITGFQKSHGTQHSLITIPKNGKVL